MLCSLLFLHVLYKDTRTKRQKRQKEMSNDKELILSTAACRRYKGFFPDIIPRIVLLTPNTSVFGQYKEVQISGLNFNRSGPLGFSTVTFGNIKNIPISFYSSLNITFVVPVIGVAPGTYEVQVVNNMFPTSKYSNKVTYTLTN